MAIYRVAAIDPGAQGHDTMGQFDRHPHDDNDYESDDEPDFEAMIANRFDEEATTERAEASYERYVYGD